MGVAAKSCLAQRVCGCPCVRAQGCGRAFVRASTPGVGGDIGMVMVMRWSCRCVHFAAIMFTATAMPHSRRLCAAAGSAHSRVVHSVSGTKHGRTFREIDGRTSLTPALTSCQALWLFLDGSPAVSSNAATQGLGRKGYGAGTDPTEREWQPYMSVVLLIRLGRSGDILEAISATGAGALSFLEDFPALGSTTSESI